MKRILTNLDLSNNEILNVKNLYTKEESDNKFVDKSNLDTSVFEIGPDGKIVVKNDSHTHTIDNITGLQDELDKKVSKDQLGVPSGIATLDDTGKVLSTQLPSYVDSVVEGYYDETTGKFYEDAAKTQEVTGSAGKIYVDLTSSKQYRWGGTTFVEISSGGVTLGETADTAYRGDLGKIAYEHSKLVTGNPHHVTKDDIGLDNVDNTPDLDKPISAATQAALDLKLDKLNAVTGVKGSAEDVIRTGDVTISKENLGLDFVENKSSTMIRNEITSQNVIDALGYTPVDPKDVPAEVTPFTGATAAADGTVGTVVQPKAGDQDKYLKGDGTWESIPTYKSASTDLGLVKTGDDVTIVDGLISVNDNSHAHTIENVTGLQDELDKKVNIETGKGLSTNDLADDLKASYDKAVADDHVHDNKAVIDTITTEKVTVWDKAVTDTHTHDNKDVIDSITEEKVTTWDKAVTDSHIHDNKTILDGITAAKIEAYDDAVTKAHVHDNKDVIDAIKDTDVTSWNDAVTKSHVHDNKDVIDGITEEKITAYDKAVTDDHIHDNKDIIDAITEANITDWNDAVAKEHEHDNKTVLDGITEDKVLGYDDAVTKAHAHDNKDAIDTITAEKLEAYDKAVTDSHTHENKTVLDGITEEKITAYDDAVAKAHVHDNKDVIDGIVEDKITAWDKAVTDSHVHTNKNIIDTITQEKIDKWDTGGSSYTAGTGVTISDTYQISTDFTKSKTETDIASSTKLVTSESTVGTLSDIGDTIKEDKQLVTFDELNKRLQKSDSSMSFGKMYVTDDSITPSDAPYIYFNDIKKCKNAFPYRDDYNDLTMFWEDDLFTGTMRYKSYYLRYLDNTGTKTNPTGYLNSTIVPYGITLNVTKSVQPHYDGAGHMSVFSCGYTNETVLALYGLYVMPPQSVNGPLQTMVVQIEISDASWTNDTIADIANTFEGNFCELSRSNPYKLFISFQYRVNGTTVKKSAVYTYPGNSSNQVYIQYDNATGTFSGNSAQYIQTQSILNIKTSTVGYFPPVKFKDVYVMGRRNTYQSYGTPIMVSYDNCLSWKNTTFSTDPPTEYEGIAIGSTPSSKWDETVQCNGNVSCVDDKIIIARVNGELVYSEDGINWHAGYFAYSSSDNDAESAPITGLNSTYIYDSTVITKSDDNTYVLAECMDINRFVYGYGVYGNLSQTTRKLYYSADGKVFRYARYQKADGKIINGIDNTFGSVVGPGVVGNVLFAKLYYASSDLIENTENKNSKHFPIYSDDGGRHWKLAKMFNAAGDDVTENDTTNYDLDSYQFTSAGSKAYLHRSSSVSEYHWYTDDGINWHPITINTTSGECAISNIVYLNGMYLAIKAVDSSNSDIMWSEDGITFTPGTVDVANSTFAYTRADQTSLKNYTFSQDIRFVNNKYIVCHDSGFMISTNGKTWINMEKYDSNTKTWGKLLGPVYRDGKYIFANGNSNSTSILYVTSNFNNVTTYGPPAGNECQYLNNTPMLLDGKIAVWSSYAGSGIGCIEQTTGEFDLTLPYIRLGDNYELYGYSTIIGGLADDAELRYFTMSDNPDTSTNTSYPYVLYQSENGLVFTVTKWKTAKYPYNLFNCYPGDFGYLIYGNSQIATSSEDGSSSNSAYTTNFIGASRGTSGGITVDNTGKFIGVSYKATNNFTTIRSYFYSYSVYSSGRYQPHTRKGIVQYYRDQTSDPCIGQITLSSNKPATYYSLSTNNETLVDFYMSPDESYCAYLTGTGIYYKDFMKNTTTKATVTDKNNNDVTAENVGYKFIANCKDTLFVLGTPQAITTENQYLVSSTNIASDDTSIILSKANAYTDEAVAKVGSAPFTGATAAADGTVGTVVQPKAGDQNKFLKGDGTWSEVSSSPAGENLGLVKTGDDVTIVDGLISVNDNSHAHTIANVTGLQTALNGKVSTVTGKTLTTNDLTNTLKTSYDKAVTNTHTHSNKSVLDGITAAKITNYDKAVTDDHTHSNKNVLDGITANNVSTWNSATSGAFVPTSWKSLVVATSTSEYTGTYTATADCWLMCYLPKPNTTGTTCYAVLFTGDYPICSVINSGAFKVETGNVVKIKKGTVVSYKLQSGNGVTAMIYINT